MHKQRTEKILLRFHLLFWLFFLSSGVIATAIIWLLDPSAIKAEGGHYVLKMFIYHRGVISNHSNPIPFVAWSAVHVVIFCISVVFLVYTIMKRNNITGRYICLGVLPCFVYLVSGLIAYQAPVIIGKVMLLQFSSVVSIIP
jgi:hypothetical protein